MSIEVAVVRVFTDAEGVFGNPLGIVAADDVPLPDRQSLAAALGFSETVFVGPESSGHAGATIYTPAVELPFAGHPTVGLSWWLRERGHPITTLTVPASNLRVRYDGDFTWVRARAEWAPHFTMHRLDSPDDLDGVNPGAYDTGHHYLWSWSDERAGSIRSRMFAPSMGVGEDEATGAAAVRITDLLGRDLDITQGRGSRLSTTIDADGWIELGGRTVSDPSITV